MENSFILREHNISSPIPKKTEKGEIPVSRKKVSISVVRHNESEMEFDIVGIHPGLANAFRRILLSEVPSMAIEKVLIYNNTSLIQDEVLAHRLGLIPLKADPRLFEYKPEEEGEPTDQDTLKFELKVKCTRNTSARKDSTHPDDLYTDYKVLSNQMKWIPIGGQADLYKAKHLGPVHDDILIAKMRPGHELNLQMLAVKGIGRDHAKFSPVATATYRLLPEITLTQEVEGDLAERLKTCFSPGVIGIKQNNEGRNVAYVENPRYDSCSRNVFRYNDLKDTVNMGRVQDHFIFTIESVGALAPDELFLESVKVLKNKCKMFLEQLNNS